MLQGNVSQPIITAFFVYPVSYIVRSDLFSFIFYFSEVLRYSHSQNGSFLFIYFYHYFFHSSYPLYLLFNNS